MNKLEALGCIEMTSQRQADNGTIRYFDPQTKAYYMLYENGYVRRSFGRYKRADGRWSDETIYQLNPKGKGYYRSPYSNLGYDTTIRIMLDTHCERMDCAARGVVNYRNTVKRNRLERLERYKNEQRRTAKLVVEDCVSMFFEGMVDFETTVNDIKESLKEAKANGLA
jgi:hypothetical protein